MTGMSCAHALRILVTDDDPIQLRAAARLLRSLGHTGALASSGQTALDLLSKQAFDVMLMDRRMPVLDGVETLKRLRPLYPRLPVILVSGDDLGANWSFYQSVGADGYLIKPMDVDSLSSALQTRR
jgi:CheY-like chemotaxis protein